MTITVSSASTWMGGPSVVSSHASTTCRQQIIRELLLEGVPNPTSDVLPVESALEDARVDSDTAFRTPGRTEEMKFNP